MMMVSVVMVLLLLLTLRLLRAKCLQKLLILL